MHRGCRGKYSSNRHLTNVRARQGLLDHWQLRFPRGQQQYATTVQNRRQRQAHATVRRDRWGHGQDSTWRGQSVLQLVSPGE